MYLKMYLAFALIRCGKIHRIEMIVMREEVYTLIDPEVGSMA